MNTSKNANMMMSRRNLLKIFGGAGVALIGASTASAGGAEKPIRRPIVNLSGSEADIVWDDALSQPFTPQTTGIYGDGYAFLYNVGSTSSAVLAYDVHAGLVSYNNNYWNTLPLGDLHVANGFMVAPSVDQNGNSGFAAFPGKALGLTQIAGFCRTQQVVSNAVDMPNGVAFIAGDGSVYSISFYVDQTQNIQSYTNWTLPLGTAGRDNPLLDFGGGSKMLACMGTSAVLCDLSSAAPTAATPVLLPGAPVQIASSGAAWYAIFNSTSGGYELNSYPWTATSVKQQNWSFHTSAVPGKPVPYNACIYFADSGGKFTAVDAQTGLYSWSVDLGGDCSSASIEIEDGVAYLINTDGTIFAVDLSSPTNANVVQNAMGSGAAFLGVENGVCTVTYMDQNQQRHLAAIDMAGEVHGFNCESTLLPDGMSGNDPASSIPALPVYHTFVQLLDTNQNPRSFCSVKISSYEQVILTDGTSSQVTLPSGQVVATANTYTVTPTTPAWMTTDASGILNLMVQAQDLSCPSLYLWATFMDRDESIVIYPDEGSTQKLQSANSSDLSAATAFDGTTLLPSSTNTADLASTIGQVVGGGVSASIQVSRKLQTEKAIRYAAGKQHKPKIHCRKRVLVGAGNPNNYISFPATTTNMLYQYPAGAEATRPYSPIASATFNVDFDGQGGIAYSPVSAQSQLHAALGLSIADFKAKIVHGANAIKHMTCTVEKDLSKATHTIISDAGDTFSFFVTTVEDAITVVAGVLKSLVKDVEKAVEWLCTLFDWKAILANKDLLKTNILSALQNFSDRINALTKTGCADVHTFFAGVKNDLQKALGNANGNFQGASIQSKQAGNNDPKTVFTNNSLGPANHFNSKLTNNVGQSQTNSTSSARLGASLMSSQFAGLKAIVENALATCAADLKQDLENIERDLKAFIKSFELLVTDPSEFVKTSFTQILELLAVDICDTLIDAADTVVETVIGIFAAMLQGLLAAATAPVSIPVISPLWEAISGDPLSFLDVVCLLGAIPYTIIKKATEASQSQKVGAISDQVQTWSIFTFFASLFDAACDADPANNPDSALSVLDLVFDSIVFGLSYPTGDTLSVLGGAYWACQFTPVIINLANTVLAITKSEAAAEYNSAVPNFLNAFGCVNGPGAVCMAFTEPTVYQGKDSLTLASNLLSNVVLFAKPGVNAGPTARGGVALLDAALPLAGLFLTVVEDS